MTRLVRRIALLTVAAGLAGGTVGATVAAFTASTETTGASFSVKRIFSEARTDSVWSISDAADGTASDESDPTAFADALFHPTKALSTTWSPSRYIEFRFGSPVPAGLTAGSVHFDLDFADAANGGGEITCVWFEIRSRSTGAVLGSRGSDADPYACEVTQTMNRTSADITAEVPDAAVANDLAIRIYVRNSSAGKAGRIDLARVRFKRYTRTWTLQRTRMVDASDGVAATSDWGLAAADDGAWFQTSGNWPSSYSGTRFVDFRPPSNVPPGATVTGATLRHRYRSATGGDTTCWGAQAISGGTVIATYGSLAAPLGCNATTAFVTETVPLPEVDTGAEAADLTIRVFMTNSGGRRTQHDLLDVTTTYSLPATGCVAPGAVAVDATRDTWADQNSATSTAGGTATEARVRSQDGSRNRRAFVYFPLPETPEGCTPTGATLRLFGSAAQGTRTIDVHRADSAWTEAGLSWSAMPAPTGPAASTANATGWREWDVLSHVQTMYGGANEGFVVKDAAENAGTGAEQRYHMRENTNTPQLVVTFG